MHQVVIWFKCHILFKRTTMNKRAEVMLVHYFVKMWDAHTHTHTAVLLQYCYLVASNLFLCPNGYFHYTISIFYSSKTKKILCILVLIDAKFGANVHMYIIASLNRQHLSIWPKINSMFLHNNFKIF